MPSWITFDHQCTTCEVIHTEMHDRADVQETVLCQDCHTVTSERVPFLNVSTAKVSSSIPEGVGKRFGHIQTQNGLRQELAEAREQLAHKDTPSNRASEKEVRTEITKFKRSKK